MTRDKEACLNEIAEGLPEILRRLHHGLPIANGEMELTVAQMRALHGIGDHGDCTMGELAHKLGITLSAATGLVDRLIQRGLVERESGKDDRRVVYVRLADAGRRAREVFRKERQRHMAGALRRLSAHELERIADSINLLRSALEAARGEEEK